MRPSSSSPSGGAASSRRCETSTSARTPRGAKGGRSPLEAIKPPPARAARPGGGTASPPGRSQAAHDGARHPEKSAGLLHQGVVMRCDFVEAHRGGAMASPADVPGLARLPGGYDDRRGRPRSRRGSGPPGTTPWSSRSRPSMPRSRPATTARGFTPSWSPGASPAAYTPWPGRCVGRVLRQDRAEVPPHDRLESRPPAGRERAGPPSRPARVGSLRRPWRTCTPAGSLMGSRIDSHPVVHALETAVARRRTRRGSGGPLGPGEPIGHRLRPGAPGRPRVLGQHEPSGELLG